MRCNHLAIRFRNLDPQLRGRNAACGARRLPFGLLMLLLSISVFASQSALTAADTTDSLARLESLSAEQKEELLRKKERFDALKEEEKDRLRELHRDIITAPNAARLQRVMSRYTQWLSSLTSAQRSELLTLPADERIDKIKELLKQQENQRFQLYVGNLPIEDRDAIYQWLERFITRHESEIIERLPLDVRVRLRDTSDDDARRRMLIWGLRRRSDSSDSPYPTSEEFAKLVETLSAETQKQFAQAKTPEEKQNRARDLVRAAIDSRSFPSVSEEDLRKFAAGLKAEDRDRLEQLDAEQAKRELRRLYFAERFRENVQNRGPWGGGRGSGPPRREGESRDGDGDPPRFGPPRGKGMSPRPSGRSFEPGQSGKADSSDDE